MWDEKNEAESDVRGRSGFRGVVDRPEVGGVNIHAAVAVDGRDRQRLERLCRYIARPPLSLERLEEHPDGRVRIQFKNA